jgi:2-succinyl-5-enolpyruvyl-6-hydroxy-3-cyclohexene-1-carboxylate synthase
VLHFGGNVVAKHLATALREWQPTHYIVVREEPMRFSPDHNVTHRFEASIAATAHALHNYRSTPLPTDTQRLHFFAQAAQELEGEVVADQPITEISAARLISRHIGTEQALFVSNSMAVRDMDMYAASLHEAGIPTAINRGASGIDGILSTAAGFACGHGKSTTLLIGDIAFLHDLNALSLLGSLTVPLQIVVLNNNGGGIFSFLPVAACDDLFETYFATPQHYSISLAAETFGLHYANPTTNSEFVAAYHQAQQSPQSTIIEIKSSRTNNLQHHRLLNARLQAIAAKLFNG